jgi:hypothetical protein
MSAKPDFREAVRYLEGDLTQRRAAEIKEQAAASPDDMPELQRAQRLVEALGANPGLDSVDLLTAIQSAIASPAPARSPGRWRWALGGFATAAALAVVAFIAPWRVPVDAFRAKGPAAQARSAWAGVEIYRVKEGRRTERIERTVRAGDGLSFSYRNGGKAPYQYLALFAVEGGGRIFWYYPAWENRDETPSSIAIRASAEAVELPDMIRHPLQPGPLRVHALFSDQPLTVREVEARLGKVDLQEETLDLTVEP